MKNPFEILAIAEDASDGAIKAAYLAKVRQYPPDQAPQEFQRIRSAYEAIKDARQRIAYRLFHYELPVREELAELLLRREATIRPSVRTIKKVLAEQLATYTIPLE